MEENRCPECGMPLKDGKCSVCGYKASETQSNTFYTQQEPHSVKNTNTKYCKHCGSVIDMDCVVCPKCGKQVEELKGNDKNIVINNSSSTSSSASANSYIPVSYGKMCNKWTAFFLCLFLGFFGAHKFYEGKVGMGIIYILTFGLFAIGWIVDLIRILFKPNPYYV